MVKTAVAQEATNECRNSFSFISKPSRVTNLSFRVSGPVTQFKAYSGNYFKQGAVIAQIDSRDFAIRKERAEGSYLQAKAEYERIKVLYEKNNLSASSYDKARADYIQAKTAYEMAANELTDTKLLAPFNGYIDEVFIEQYQDVKTAQSIVSFADIEQIRIELFVNQQVAIQAKQMDTIQLSFDAMPQKSYTANVIDISKSTTNNNLSYLLTALLPNKGGEILPGMSGKVYFETEKPEPTISVPQTALMHRPTEGSYLWTIHPTSGLVNKCRVTPGAILPDGKVEIKKGIAAGAVVAVSGLRFLSDGVYVTPESVQKESEN